LSNGLRSLLISVLKKTEEAREKMTAFTQALLDDTDYATRVDLPPLESLTLLQQSVVFWHCQRYHFQNVRQALKPEQFFSLSTHSFVDQPGRMLSEINEFLSLRLSPEQLDETVHSGAFRQHSKKGSRYGPEQQRAEASETASRYASEIQSALLWASPLLKRLPPEPMSRDEDPLE